MMSYSARVFFKQYGASLFLTTLLVLTNKIVRAQVLTNDSFLGVNSTYDELNPVLSPDGKTLFFTLANHPQNIGGKKDPGDIWFSVLTDGHWTNPVHGGNLINDRAYNAVAGISNDGTQLFLISHYDPTGNGTASTQGISISKNNGLGWSRPENISIPYFQNRSSIVGGYVSPDKAAFVFSSETYGTHGVEDLYVSLNEDGKWTEPQNLGAGLNTQFQEVCPSLSEDGKTIYFSSNGRKGSGSFDIYSSKRLDDTWKNWSEPVNISSINTSGRELFYREYQSKGFSLFISTKNSDGYGDIKIDHPEDFKQKIDTLQSKPIASSSNNIVTIDYKEVVADNKLVKIYGKVANSKTGEPIEAKLIFVGPKISNTTVSSGNGFSILIPAIDIYAIKIEAKGYISVLEKLDIRNYEMKDLELAFKLQPVEVGTVVNLESVLFDRGTSVLLPESDSELDLIVSFMKSNPNVKIELSGHTDNRGDPSDNVKLSQDRVNTVRNYLIAQGIEGKRITGKGYGGQKPIASNDSEETRKLNRRVEFMIKKF